MTKERRLAIQMWEQIKAELARDPKVNIVGLKINFCSEHGLVWFCNCWLCQYIPHCEDCPLSGCLNYVRAVDERKPLEIRLNACSAIINALKGKSKG